jgi:Phage integrase protein
MATATKEKKVKSLEELEHENIALHRILDEDQETRERIRRVSEELDVIKEQRKSKVAEREGLIKAYIQRRLDQASLFDAPKPEPKTGTPAPSTNGTAPPAVDDESWKPLQIGVLQEKHGLPATLVNKLSENGIHNLGQLYKVKEENTKDGKQWHTSLTGIGLTKAEQIEDALTKFWAEREKQKQEAAQAAAQQPAEAATKEDEADDDDDEDEDE